MPRKQKKHHFIYKTTNEVTGKYYIGMHSTDDLEDGYLGSGKRLRYSVRKYGPEAHRREILEFCESRDELKSREREIVDMDEIAKIECMNLTTGGVGFDGAYSIEACRKGALVRNAKMWQDPAYVERMRKMSSENMTRKHVEGKISYPDWTGRRHTEESKRKIGKTNSVKQKGNRNSQFGTRWITNGEKNVKIKDNILPEGWKYGRTA